MNKNSNKMSEDEHGNMETLGDMKPAPLTSPSTHPPLLCLRIALAETHFKVTKIWTLKSWFSQTFFESGPKPKKNIEKPSCFATNIGDFILLPRMLFCAAPRQRSFGFSQLRGHGAALGPNFCAAFP